MFSIAAVASATEKDAVSPSAVAVAVPRTGAPFVVKDAAMVSAVSDPLLATIFHQYVVSGSRPASVAVWLPAARAVPMGTVVAVANVSSVSYTSEASAVVSQTSVQSVEKESVPNVGICAETENEAGTSR